MLTEQQAADIYLFKVLWQQPAHAVVCQEAGGMGARSLAAHSQKLSKQYGVSTRAIRDIWGRRSWQYATYHLWAQEERDLILDSTTPAEVQVFLDFILIDLCEN